jgi:hypothetical protein
MYFIEDFLQPPSAEKSPPASNSKGDLYGGYKSGYGGYQAGNYVNSGKPPSPAGPPAPAKAPVGQPRKYGPDVVVHEKGKDYKGEEQRGVEYASLADRVRNYKVAIAGKMTRGSASEIIDTPSMKGRAVQAFGAANIGNATLDQGPTQLHLAREWSQKALIWVCVPIDANDVKQSVFYTHVCRPNAFHHSSLSAGREVYGGGEWIVEAGALKKISANSGHYQPSLSSLHQCVLALSPAWQADTTVFLWNKNTSLWEDVPVNAFAKDPTGGGQYKAHPRSL